MKDREAGATLDVRLRIGEARRVYYDVAEGPEPKGVEPLVLVQAIGIKIHNQVFIAGLEIRL